jgi:hypothetical protein
MTKNNAPTSFKELFAIVFKNIFLWISIRHWTIKLLSFLFIVISIFLLARFNILGDKLYNLTVLILGTKVPPENIIHLNFGFEIQSQLGVKIGINGQKIYKNEKVSILLNSASDCFVTAFLIDSPRVIKLLDNSLKSLKITGDKKYTFTLDNKINSLRINGYAIASKKAFNLSKAVSKSIKYKPFSIELSEKFIQKEISFIVSSDTLKYYFFKSEFGNLNYKIKELFKSEGFVFVDSDHKNRIELISEPPTDPVQSPIGVGVQRHYCYNYSSTKIRIKHNRDTIELNLPLPATTCKNTNDKAISEYKKQLNNYINGNVLQFYYEIKKYNSY